MNLGLNGHRTEIKQQKKTSKKLLSCSRAARADSSWEELLTNLFIYGHPESIRVKGCGKLSQQQADWSQTSCLSEGERGPLDRGEDTRQNTAGHNGGWRG